jgi:hypothetical protein
MERLTYVALVVVLTVMLSGQSKPDWQTRLEACVAALSSFAVDPAATPQPQIPKDLEGVTLQLNSSGCLGNCPSFTLRLEKNRAVWEGRAFVKKKGKAVRQISEETFGKLVRAWLDADMYAMRDDYCGYTCPDGTEAITLDAQETSVTLTTPAYSKKVFECFTTIDGKPQTPKPPEQYFQFSRQLIELAKSSHWL